MAYVVRTVGQIGGDDGHGYFIYFLPSLKLHYEWINRFFADEFLAIARRIGPDGVVVVPCPGAEESYTYELASILMPPKSKSTYDNLRNLHSGKPFLVVSLRPLRNLTSKPEEINAVALNLSGIDNLKELASLIDRIIDAKISDDLMPTVTSISKYLAKRPRGEAGLGRIVETLELKPNVMGIGININAIFRIIFGRQKKKLARTIATEDF